METTHTKRVITFLILLAVLTGISHILPAVGILKSNMAPLLIMWSPGLAALATIIITKLPFKTIGWKFSIKWIAIGWSIPVIYSFAAYSLVWISGLGGVPNPTFLERARFTLGMPASPEWIIIISAFFYITLINLIPAAVMSLGEELGWRGFLVPGLSKTSGFKKASWLSGIIWAIWHLPGILSGEYLSDGTPLLYQISCFLLMVVSTGIILAWLRMKSNSIWPAVVFHATHNGVIQMFFNRITIDTGHTSYFTGEFGIALIPFTLLGAWYFYRRSGEIES